PLAIQFLWVCLNELRTSTMARRAGAAKASCLMVVFIVQIVYRVKNCLRLRWFFTGSDGRTKDIRRNVKLIGRSQPCNRKITFLKKEWAGKTVATELIICKHGLLI